MWTAENRARYERKGRYPSDVLDEEWALVEPHLPPQRNACRREILNAILYVLTTGCQWRALPKDFPPKSTVHDYFVEWHSRMRAAAASGAASSSASAISRSRSSEASRSRCSCCKARAAAGCMVSQPSRHSGVSARKAFRIAATSIASWVKPASRVGCSREQRFEADGG